jgi:hypothetical protein
VETDPKALIPRLLHLGRSIKKYLAHQTKHGLPRNPCEFLEEFAKISSFAIIRAVISEPASENGSIFGVFRGHG